MADIVITGNRFQELEATIEQGKQTFVAVGIALLEIRDSRAYRLAGWDTFEAYCQERWGWTRRHANRLIGAAEVAGNLVGTSMSQLTPTQAATLAPLPPEQQRAVADAVDFTETTVRQLRDIVRETQHTLPAPPPNNTPTIERMLEAVPDYQRAALLATFTRYTRYIAELVMLDPVSAAESSDAYRVQSFRQLDERYRQWADAYLAAVVTGIQEVRR